MNQHKLLKIVSIVISVIAIILYFVTLGYEKEELMESSLVSIFIYLAYIGFFIALGVVLVYLIKSLKDPKFRKSFLIVSGICLGLFLLSYILADSTPQYNANRELVASEGVSKMVGALLNMFYFMAFISLGVLVYFGFKKVKR